MSIELTGWPKYQFIELKNFKEVRAIFPDGQADQYNWLFCSLKSFHSDDLTLAQIERILLGAGQSLPESGKWPVGITIFHGRTHCLKYGYLEIDIEDIDYLRSLVRSTLEEIAISQEKNI